MNPYLKAKREQYEALRTTIEGVQTRAAEEGRDLTEDELRSVKEQGEQARKLADEIQALTEIENRHAAVAGLAVDVAKPEETRAAVPVSGTTTRDRDPGHYRKGAGYSFFGDLFAARSLQDEDARRRLTEHNRALDMANEGPGVIPPVWMTQEFEQLAAAQRRVANAVRNIPLASAAPISMPKQTAGAFSNSADSGSFLPVVKEQSSEGDATVFDDVWDSDVATVTPKATSGGQKVSRQMLDSSNPAVDALIYGDLVAAYNQLVEAKVVGAMVTAAGSAVKTYATEAAFMSALEDITLADDLLDTATAVRAARKLPADVLICGVTRYGQLLKMKDASGRPLIPSDSGGPMNVIGTGTVAVDGRVHGLGVLASDGITGYPESILVARASDTILFESPTLRFRYEEPDGPEVIRLGIWAYTAVHVKYSGASVKRLVVTAAS